MMEYSSQIIGTWSVDIMYGPGAMSDERVIFLSDGTGWMEIFNGNLVTLEIFTWKLINKKLNIFIYCIHSITEESPKESKVELHDIDFLIEDELTKNGDIMKTITFSRQICLNDYKFGFMSPDVIAKLEMRISQIKEGYEIYFKET